MKDQLLQIATMAAARSAQSDDSATAHLGFRCAADL